MAKLSEIKQKNPELNFSLIDFLTLVDTSDTNKFVPMMINCINSEFKKRISSREIQFHNLRMDKIKSKFLESKKDLNYIEPFIDFFNHILLDTCGKDIILDFMDLYQRNYVENLDLNTISDLDQLREIYNKAHSKFIANTSHKEVVKVIDDQEWLIVRPLTYESSRAYGAGTKWCTTSKDNPHHFFRYYSRGILIYCINKITGYKVAVFWDVNDESSPTFWNVLDIQIDSMMTELPPYILKHIKNLPKTSNASLCDKKTLEINRQYEIETKLLSLEPDHEVENMAGVEDNFNGD